MRRHSSTIFTGMLTIALGAFTIVGVQVGADAAGRPHHAHEGSTSQGSNPFTVSQILLGGEIGHTFTPTGSATSAHESLSNPDDITRLGDRLFVAFQNGVGPKGEASTSGNLDSTVVELTFEGRELGQWDLAGRVDGLTADPTLRGVIATVNEDANSALFVVRPDAPSVTGQVTKFSYDNLTHGGGTDSIAVLDGRIFISASSPGTSTVSAPDASFPAVYAVKLDRTTLVAKMTPLFFDEDVATVANVGGSNFGSSTNLALTDPDSSEVVPATGPRFAGDFVLTSQGDQQQIYVSRAGSAHQRLSVLSLSQAVDDTAWPTSMSGHLYSTDATNDSVDVVTGPFHTDQPLVAATPCGSNSAASDCSTPNYLATLNPWTGAVTPITVSGPAYEPKGGLVFVPDANEHGHGTSHGFNH